MSQKPKCKLSNRRCYVWKYFEEEQNIVRSGLIIFFVITNFINIYWGIVMAEMLNILYDKGLFFCSNSDFLTKRRFKNRLLFSDKLQRGLLPCLQMFVNWSKPKESERKQKKSTFCYVSKRSLGNGLCGLHTFPQKQMFLTHKKFKSFSCFKFDFKS